MNEDEKEVLSKELREIIDHVTPTMIENYPQIRGAYQNHYGWPELDPVRHEITLCLLCGFAQAAITLTNHLTESFLKFALAYHHTKLGAGHRPKSDKPTVQDLVGYTKEGLDRYQSNELAANINAACSLGLISKSEKKQLHEFRDRFRNAYGHADKRRTFGAGVAPITPINLDAGGNAIGQEEEVSIPDLPMIQGLLQAMLAKHDAIPYFLFVDKLVREVMDNRLGMKPQT